MTPRKLSPFANVTGIVIGVASGLFTYIIALKGGFHDQHLPIYSITLGGLFYLATINIGFYLGDRRGHLRNGTSPLSWISWNFSGYFHYHAGYPYPLLLVIAAIGVAASLFFLLLTTLALASGNVLGTIGAALIFVICGLYSALSVGTIIRQKSRRSDK